VVDATRLTTTISETYLPALEQQAAHQWLESSPLAPAVVSPPTNQKIEGAANVHTYHLKC